MRLAVIGGGPKALAALTELDRALDSRGALDNHGAVTDCRQPRMSVDVFDPHELGPGAVWDRRTPEYLLMNVPSRIVDLSGPSFPLSYAQWAESHPDSRAREVFPPRRFMGEYLRRVCEGLINSPRLRVRQVRRTVTDVQRTTAGWWLVGDGSTPSLLADEPSPLSPSSPLQGAGFGEERGYDAVLLATGHRAPLLVNEYHALAQDEALTGQDIHIRGAALTGIDYVMTLTLGRGGYFDPAPVADAAALLMPSRQGLTSGEPERLRYVPSGREPRTITLHSRTGVPLSPKPPEQSQELIDHITQATAKLLMVVSSAEPQPSADWWDTLVRAAHSTARFLNIDTGTAALERTLLTPDHLEPGETAVERMRSHLLMNLGHVTPDERWIWGRVWNLGYRNIIDSLARHPRDAAGWNSFRLAASNAERWAYGPPQTTVERLLALTETGLLRWEAAGSSPIPPEALNAITQPPGVRDERTNTIPDPLWNILATSGYVSVRDHERGIITTPQAQCLGPDGTPTSGLYAIGRPTEDPVIGHDTLNHRLHAEIQQWAQHLVDIATEGT